MRLNKIEAKLNLRRGWPASLGDMRGHPNHAKGEVRQLHLPVMACACKMLFLLPTPPFPLQ